MDWKKITNKVREQADRNKTVQETADSRERKQESAAADSGEREKLERCLNEMLPELNLRLLLAMEADKEADPGNGRAKVFLPAAHMLWIESITVTAYERPFTKSIFQRLHFHKKRKQTAAGPAAGSPEGQTGNRLMGLRGKRRTLKK